MDIETLAKTAAKEFEYGFKIGADGGTWWDVPGLYEPEDATPSLLAGIDCGKKARTKAVPA